MPVMKDDWIDPNLLSDTSNLLRVRASVYIMQGRSPGSFHVGIVGRSSLTNTAQRRLGQVFRGHHGNPPAPFQYIFLAPLPDDLGHQLADVEILLQNELSRNFGGNAAAPVWLPTPPANVAHIQILAQDVVLCFLQNRYAGSATALIPALQAFVSLAGC